MKASKIQIIIAAIAVTAILAMTGCGTTANLAGASVSIDVAQHGTAVGVTLAGGTNSVTIGATYANGTNQSIVVGTTIPTK